MRLAKELKMLFFNPGKKINGLLFISDKTEIFGKSMADKYYMNIDYRNYNNVPCYVFTVKAKEDKKSNVVIDEMTTWFNEKTFEIVARNYGYYYGIKNKVRINTVSQSPTKTTAGSGVKSFDGFQAYAEKMSPLGNASADDCAGYCAVLFSDLTRMVTMQNLFHDGGFSFTGVTEAVIAEMEKGHEMIVK